MNRLHQQKVSRQQRMSVPVGSRLEQRFGKAGGNSLSPIRSRTYSKPGVSVMVSSWVMATVQPEFSIMPRSSSSPAANSSAVVHESTSPMPTLPARDHQT